ncbi:hypothetical protein TNCV_2689181 [Trichonephila clavipes]|nr:hypothetical protein TNCV_2689181 [Trichonephila clavipes]
MSDVGQDKIPQASPQQDEGSQTKQSKNRAHADDLYARRPMVCIQLVTDTMDPEKEYDFRRILVRREGGTQNNPIYVQKRSHYRRSGLMVWDGISVGGRTNLYYHSE